MAFWPFGRNRKSKSKSKRKKSSTTNDSSSATADEKLLESMAGPGRVNRRNNQPGARDAPDNQIAKTRQPEIDPEKGETPSQPPVGAGTTRASPNAQPSLTEKAGIPPEPQRRKASAPAGHSQRGDVPSYYFQNPTSQSSLQPETFTVLKRPPTLRAKRSATESNMPRRKSSKRKAEDQAREQEIKAMSAPMPVPKRHTHGGVPASRETGKVHHGGLNRPSDRPTSEVSLPLPESMHSTTSAISDQRAVKIGALDALTPRPTIRYSDTARSGPGSRASTRRDKRPAIPDEMLRQNKRVEDLADDMDATGLRELMERDRRRREKKRQADQDKMQRKLQRRADEQRAEEEERRGKRRAGDRSGKSIEPGVLNREEVGLQEAQPSESHAEGATQYERNVEREGERKSPESWLHDPSKEHLPPEDPFRDPAHETDQPRTEEPTPADDLEEPVLGTAQAVRLSQASMSPPTSPREREHARGPSNLSTVTDLARHSVSEQPERAEPDRRGSDTSGRAAGSWTSFFRRGVGRGKRHSADRGQPTPSEFSNTSRESFARQNQHQPPLPPYQQRNLRNRSGTPVRTQSKFREDLPELPISPPDSRVQSPEAMAQADTRYPYPDQRAISPLAETTTPLEDIHPAFREEVAAIRQQSLDINIPSPSPGLEYDNAPSSALLSQSLASVDSEGSWLSGRPVKRTSKQSQHQRGSVGSLQRRLDEFSNERDSEDERPRAEDESIANALAEDEYLSRFHPGLDLAKEKRLPNPHLVEGAPGHGQAHARRKTLDSDDSDDERLLVQSNRSVEGELEHEGTFHSAGPARHPTIVRQDGPRFKSREGLLNEFLSSAQSPSQASPSDEEGIRTTRTPTKEQAHAEPVTRLDAPSPSSDLESPDSPTSMDESDFAIPIQRATSVDFGGGQPNSGRPGIGHVRHISAGSAKLLDLPARSGGGDHRLNRLSGASGVSASARSAVLGEEAEGTQGPSARNARAI